MKRRGYESLARRLAKRECHGAPAGAVAPQSRRFYESIVPDTAIPGVVPPPNTVLSCFTPCGHFLVAFQPVSNELVAFRFKGLHIATSAHVRQPDAAGSHSGGTAGGAADGAAAGAAVPPPQVPPSQSSQPAPHQTVLPLQQDSQQQDQLLPARGHEQGPRQAAQQRQVSFSDVFEEHWRCCPCPGRQEQISTDFCLVAHGRFLLVATSSPEHQPPRGARGAAQLVPTVDTTTLHLVDLDSGSLLDSHTIHLDYVELMRNQGVHLRGHLLLVLGLASQTLYMLQLLPAGRLMYLHAIGQHCREDDAWVIAQQEERERRLRQHQRWRGGHQQQHQHHHAAHSTLGTAGSFSSLSPAAGAGAAGAHSAARGSTVAQPLPAQQGQRSAPIGGRPAAANVATHGVSQGPGVEPAFVGQDSGSEGGEDGEEDLDGEDMEQGRPAGPGAEQSRLIDGLKQCLLACLFREAQQQSQAAAAAAAAAEATSTTAGGGQQVAVAAAGDAAVTSGHGPLRASGSTGSLPSTTVAPRLQRFAGSSSNLAGLVQGQHGAQRYGGGSAGVLPHWRRPMDRFYYYFEAHLELLMWKAQLLDEQRLLVHWCPPEMLAGPHRHQHHGHSAAAAAGQQGSYMMLYNWVSAAVEQLFVAHSPELAAWYLHHPAAFHSGGCVCGCTVDWDRWVVPPAASRIAREHQLRDPALAAKELRHRLADELPASCQMRQATPYLDPDLYCYDERAIGGAIRPHHPPHRSIKFMCRCQPERLRFRLDPEHLQPAQVAGSRTAAASAAARAHVVYLFHPVQPFLLTVMQDIESAVAERLTLFVRV